MSSDDSDTLSYNCTADSVDETFSIRTFRFFGSAAGAKVYFHCELKVCLADSVGSACECPKLPCGMPSLRRRRRRSVADMVDESEVYYVTAGPFIFQSHLEEEKENEEEEEVNKEGTYNEFIAISIVYLHVNSHLN